MSRAISSRRARLEVSCDSKRMGRCDSGYVAREDEALLLKKINVGEMLWLQRLQTKLNYHLLSGEKGEGFAKWLHADKFEVSLFNWGVDIEWCCVLSFGASESRRTSSSCSSDSSRIGTTCVIEIRWRVDKGTLALKCKTQHRSTTYVSQLVCWSVELFQTLSPNITFDMLPSTPLFIVAKITRS